MTAVAPDSRSDPVVAAFIDLPIAAAVLDRELRYVAVNEALARANGLSRADHIGRLGPELLPQVSPDAWEAMRRVIETGVSARGVLVTGQTHATRDGEAAWIEEYTPWRDAATGKILGVIATVIDITEQRRAERRAAQRQARIEGIGRLASDLVGVRSAEAIAQRLVECALDVLGAEASTVVLRDAGADLRIGAAAGPQSAVKAAHAYGTDLDSAVADTARTGIAHFISAGPDLDARFPTGARICRDLGLQSVATIPLMRNAEILGGLSALFRERQAFDDDDRATMFALGSVAGNALAAAASAAAEDRVHRLLDTVIEHLPFSLIVAEPPNRLTYRNPATVRLWGAPALPAGALDLADYHGTDTEGKDIRPDDWPLARALRGEAVPDTELFIETFDGRRLLVRVRAEPVRDHAGELIAAVCVLDDVTERRHREAMRDAFIDVTAHELRTPLTTIYGSIEALRTRQGTLNPEDRDELLAAASIDAERVVHLVEDLLVLSRVERGVQFVTDEPVLLNHVIADAVAADARRHSGEPPVVHIAGGLPPVSGEPVYIAQVLTNFLSNARKYGAAPIEIVAEKGDASVAVRVIDRGAGFAGDPDVLFELYYREPGAKRQAAGAGIGLFVCRELIGAMGGQTWATNRPDGGAEFGFSLRIYAEQSE